METITGVITMVIGIITDLLEVFMTPPALWFVGIALVSAAAGVARKFVPMRKR